MKHRNKTCSDIFKLKNTKMQFCSKPDKIVGLEAGNTP